MTRNSISFSAVAVLAASFTLAACGGSGDETAAANAQAEANAADAAAEANLPPSIQASRVYRCHDNSLVYVDFFTDDTAAIRTEEIGTPTRLTHADGAAAFTAEGYSVAANAERTSITVPGKSAQTCRVRA